jgi:Zn-dependent peptidase ImmA (M78 family)
MICQKKRNSPRCCAITFSQNTVHDVMLCDNYSLGPARDLIPDYARALLAQSLAYLPENVIDFVVENLIFITPEAQGRGMYFSFTYTYFEGRKGFILIPESTWDENLKQIAFVITHEIAHALLNHEIRTIDDMEKEKREREEIEADRLAVKWLSKHHKRESLMKLCDSAYGKK